MPTYSHSRLETYENCPRQFKLQYVDKVEIEETESIEAFLGNRVHEALEKLYKDVRMTRLPAQDEIIAYFDAMWDKNWHEGVTIVRDDYSVANYKELGRKCLAEYYEQYRPFNQSRTIALEHLVTFPLDESGKYTIRGVIDRISLSDDGVYMIHDYKTSGRLKTQEEVDRDRQLALYHIALGNMWEDVKQVDLVWHYLVFGKELRSRRTEGELDQVKQEVVDIIRKIEGDTDFRPRESALCDWCPYPEYCPAKKHILLTQRLSANKYLAEPGVKLVNRYADLDRKKGEIESELSRVKDALINYARENRVEVIKGSDHRVLVRFYKGLSFPRKDEPLRRELEALVKRLGLWEKVTVMSPVSLAKLIERGDLDPELARTLSTMGKEEERPWVKLCKPRGRDRSG
jgi:putative RecB family exonuclease